MRSLALTGDKDDLGSVLTQVREFDPSVLFWFVAPALLNDPEFVSIFVDATKSLPVIGCSTSGEISRSGMIQNSFSLLALAFDDTTVRMVHTPMPSVQDCYTAGTAIADALQGPKLRAVLLFAPGVQVNGSDLIDGLRSLLGRSVFISGALAADEFQFKKTVTFLSGDLYERDVVGIGFYGDSICCSNGSEGGWRPFGPARRVTKAVGNVLVELDGKPALQLYKHYLGEKARDLPASGLSYPFAVLRQDRTTSGIIRSALDVDQQNETIILAATIEQGCQVCLMHADNYALSQGAAQAAAEALRTHSGPEENGAALLVSCVGRRALLGIDIDDEIEAVADSLLPDIPMAGFYANGEICSMEGNERTVLHNQTMTVTYFSELKGE
ncbi:MAG: FIST signal transduction protein [Bdellovibrionales bacterium]